MLRCLLVDNDDDFLALSKDLFEERLSDQGFPAEVRAVRTTKAARDVLEKAGPNGFDLVFTDMLFEPLDDPAAAPADHVDRGSEVIAAAVRAKAGFVVAYTKSGGDKYASLYAAAGRAKVDYFCTRQQLTAGEHETVFAELAGKLRTRFRAGEFTGRDEDSSTTAPDPQRVAVIYGANDDAVKGVFTWLRSIGLKPVEFAKAVEWTDSGSPPITDILDQLFLQTQAVVVLLTPDECVRLHPRLAANRNGDKPGMQARPNVFFEAGMAWVLNRSRTIFVRLGNSKTPSDLSGLHAQVISDDPKHRNQLFDRLQKAGCAVERSDAMMDGSLICSVRGIEYEPDVS